MNKCWRTTLSAGTGVLSCGINQTNTNKQTNKQTNKPCMTTPSYMRVCVGVSGDETSCNKPTFAFVMASVASAAAAARMCSTLLLTMAKARVRSSRKCLP